MSTDGERHILRGAVAGVAGGLVASWLMNEFMTGPGKQLQQSLQDGSPPPKQKSGEEEDATMKAADAVVEITTGGRHLSHEQRKKGGPIVHYAYGALMGGIYGGVAEFSETARAGLGTIFGSALFLGGDLVAVPALHLAPAPTDQPPSSMVNPFAAHLVYGSTTELVRRAVRALW